MDLKNKKIIICDLGLIEYERAWEIQKEFHKKRTLDEIDDVLFLCEHPHTYTLGKTAEMKNLLFDEQELHRKEITVFNIDRGGDITYHGHGQIVGYAILNLAIWKKDTHLYLRALEDVVIDTCKDYGIESERNNKYTGVWIEDRKICAIGIKVSRWITMHGFAFNVNTDLNLFDGIIPCGIQEKEVTTLSKELES
ncbi:MAG: lipoyl(octanoyl) transferase LipB, partial [Ignavibacteriae bacterium]|nr:lipoyl(octanoyl) transferase LipB [Ignavibacteriota bacterium]